jgi:thymidylate synthase (FAD)
MHVKLIGITKPTEVETAEELVAYTARVSNPANQNNKETAGKLVKYLIKEAHWSPFEMVHLLMEITTTRDISRQIIRHRSFSFQEFSQRYAKATNFITDREPRLQDPKNRQNSIYPDNDIVVPLSIGFEKLQKEVVDLAQTNYQKALDMGIAKEQARALLPEGLTETTLYMSGTLRSWIHYVDLRQSNGTQAEHRDIALKCKEIILEQFPMLSDYWAS